MIPATVLPHLVDLAMAILLIEAVALAWLRCGPRPRHGLKLREIALIALAGLGLLLALRGALSEAGAGVIVAGLSLGGLAHAADLVLRLRAASAQKR